jgi:hypothetical protein
MAAADLMVEEAVVKYLTKYEKAFKELAKWKINQRINSLLSIKEEVVKEISNYYFFFIKTVS